MVEPLYFEPLSHTYRVGERPVHEHVTGVLVRAGMNDYRCVDPVVLREARDRGIRVHELCAHRDNTGAWPAWVEPHLGGYCEAYDKFWRDSGYEPIASEVPVYHEALDYAGTADMIGWLGGERALIERKATAAVPPSAAIQSAAYKAALPSQYGRVEQRYVLVLGMNGTYRLSPCLRWEHDWNVWLAALDVSRALRENREPHPHSPEVLRQWQRKAKLI